MNQKAPSEQLIPVLQQMRSQGLLDPALMHAVQVGMRGVLVEGDVQGPIITGDQNTIIYQTSAPEPPVAPEDIQPLLQQTITTYREHLLATRRAAPSNSQPYRGLDQYRLQDADNFFGRKQESELFAQILTGPQQVIWLHGRSGVGKTSFILAGLFTDLLDQGHLPVYVRALDDLPTTKLKEVLLRENWSTASPLAKDTLLQFVNKVRPHLNGHRLYIFFDQFEDFYARADTHIQKQFAQELANCVQSTGPEVCFIFSLRSDYYGETYALRQQLKEVSVEEFQLRPLSLEGSKQAITEPAAKAGITFDPELPAQMIGEMSPDNLAPQLQLICQHLINRLPSGVTTITADYFFIEQGGASGILQNYLNQALDDVTLIPPNLRAGARFLLTNLVSVNGQRRQVTLSDWYNDELLEPLALRWHFRRLNQPVPRSHEDLRHVALADYQQTILDITTSQNAELADLQTVMAESITTAYLLFIRADFVKAVVETLDAHRLITPLITAEGSRAYELVHDYLIGEIQSWLSQAQKEAGEVRQMLDQQQHEFAQHQILLSQQKLDIVAAQLPHELSSTEAVNPLLRLTADDRRLLLYSALAQGKGIEWLPLAREQGIPWLRDAYRTAGLPLAGRLEAIACLGILGDKISLQALTAACLNEKQEDSSLSQADARLFLVHYLHHAKEKPTLPFSLQLVIWPARAQLQRKTGKNLRDQMRRAALIAALVSIIIIVPSLSSDLYLLTGSFVSLVFAILASVTAVIYAESMTSLTLILRRQHWLVSLLMLTLAGSLVGTILFSFLILDSSAWFAGGLLGAVIAVTSDRLPPLGRFGRIGLAFIIAAVISYFVFRFALMAPAENPLTKIAQTTATGAFCVIYLAYWFKQLSDEHTG